MPGTSRPADYTSGDPVYLSFGIGAGRKWSDLHVWHHDTGGWTEYLPNDLNYDGAYASFTVTGFSGYAMTVPEPGSLSLLAVVCLADRPQGLETQRRLWVENHSRSGSKIDRIRPYAGRGP